MSGLLGHGTHSHQPQAGKPFLAPPKGQGPWVQKAHAGETIRCWNEAVVAVLIAYDYDCANKLWASRPFGGEANLAFLDPCFLLVKEKSKLDFRSWSLQNVVKRESNQINWDMVVWRVPHYYIIFTLNYVHIFTLNKCTHIYIYT